MGSDPDRSRLWRAARIATRIVLERSGGAGLRNLDFEIKAGGRPGLRSSGLHFSVSHSGEGALIAVSKEMLIGVDLERARSLTMSAERRRRIIAAAERLADQLSPPVDSTDSGVLIAWVRLEAAAKARGTGIGRLLTEEGVIGSQEANRALAPADVLQARSLTVSDGYVAAIAAARLPDEIAVLSFPTENLREFLAGTSP
jgi:4'-phosphopantetheinyl transferase